MKGTAPTPDNTDRQAALALVARRPVTESSRISAILLAQGPFPTFARSLQCLLDQSRPDILEVILVVQRSDALAPARELLEDTLHPGGWQLLHGSLCNRPLAGLECIRLASCPVAAFCEDHSFVSPGWIECLDGAFAADPSVLAAGPAMRNGNPGTAISRAQFALFFGEYSTLLGSHGARPLASLPPHNTAYRRQAILSQADAGTLLQAEGVLQAALKRRQPGAIFMLTGGACADHVNMSLWRPALRHALLGGRIFAQSRATSEGWPLSRRLLHAILFPLAAAAQFRRKVGAILRESPPGSRLADFTTAAVLCAIHAAAEAWGLIAGAGPSLKAYAEMEGERGRSIRPEEISIVLPS